MVRGAILTMSGNPLGAVISSDVTIFHEFHHSSPKPGIGIWPEELPPQFITEAALYAAAAAEGGRQVKGNLQKFRINFWIPRLQPQSISAAF